MKLAYVTTYNSRTLQGSQEWSGTGHYIAQALEQQSFSLDYLGPLHDPLPLQALRKLKRRYYQLLYRKNYQQDADPLTLKGYAHQIAEKLSRTKADIVFGATINPLAYLDCDRPIAFWADATFANIQNFYPLYSNLPRSVVRDWHQMEQLALAKCQLAIYSSDWAAKSAIHDYGADPAKVKVVPFGSNTTSPFTTSTIKDAIASRPTDRCKLLFLAVDWFRKGGNIAYQVAEQLNRAGLKTELTVVGCEPPLADPLPDFVRPLGFISKSTAAGTARIQQLILESHLLILPTIADCTPIVFCEANALGVPCLSTTVGGIPSIIQNDINGRLFDRSAAISEYCDYITNIFNNYSNYQKLAGSAFDEYESRLNWRVAGQTVKSLLETIV